MKRLMLFFGAFILISSCSTSKFDYQTAYKFSYYKQQQHQQEQEQEVSEVPLVASTKSEIPIDRVKLPDNIVHKQNQEADAYRFVETYQNASKAEKRAIRKQVKQDYKTLRKEYRKAKEDAVTKDIVFNKKMYIGLIVFAAGLLIAILANGPIGAVAIIVGIGLIAWGFIEQA